MRMSHAVSNRARNMVRLALERHLAETLRRARARRLALSKARTLRVIIPHDLMDLSAESLPCKKYKASQQACRDYAQEQIWGLVVAINRAERHRNNQEGVNDDRHNQEDVDDDDSCFWQECETSGSC